MGPSDVALIAAGAGRTKMGSKHVAVVGFYGHGNFGDECYAMLFARTLHRSGISASVFRIGQSYAAPFGIESVSSLDGLLENADVLLWGGGGLLVPWPRLVYRAMFPGVAAELQDATRRAIRKGIRLAASSVGGDGSVVKVLTPSYKDEFIRAASFATVRNPQDVATLRRFGVRGDYFPDLIWLVGENVPRPVRPPGGMRIAFELYRSTLLRNAAPYLIPLLQQLVDKRRDCRFYFLDSTTDGTRPYAGLGSLIHGPNVARHQLSGFEDDLQFLASLDLLVSSRLHVPMVALQFGVPVLSLLAERKTSLAFANLGRGDLSLGHRRMVGLYRLLSCRKSLDLFLRDFRFPDIQSLRAGASGHIRLLCEWLTGGAT